MGEGSQAFDSEFGHSDLSVVHTGNFHELVEGLTQTKGY